MPPPRKIEPSPDELLAFQIVGEALGVEVIPHDDNSKPRMVDGLIQLADGTQAALEIIGDHDSDFNALWNKLNKSGHRVEMTSLAHLWHVGIEHSVNINGLMKELPTFLLDLEVRAITSTMDMPIRREGPFGGVYERMEALGIGSARQDADATEGGIQFWAAGWSGTAGLGDDVLADWIATVLSEQTDVAPKLRDHPGVDQRHAFIWATMGSNYAVQSYLEDDGPLTGSTTAPQLPDGLTHIWVAGLMSSQGVVAWFPDRGWWRAPWRWPATDRGKELVQRLQATLDARGASS